MIPYIVLILIVFFVAILSIHNSLNSNNNIKIIIASLVLLTGFFAGMRYEIGHDYGSYTDHYNKMDNVFHFESKYASLETGYEFIVSIFKTISNKPNLFFLTFSLLTMIVLGKLSLKSSPYPGLTFLLAFSLLYFPMVMGQIRQPIAMGLTYLSWSYIEKNKKILFSLILLTIGFFFHKSIWFFIPFIFIIPYKMSLKQMLILVIISLFVGTSLKPILLKIASLFSESSSIGIALKDYLSWKANPVFFSLGMMEKLVTFSVILFFSSKQEFNDKYPKAYMLVNTYFWGIIVYFGFIHITDAVARLALVFMFSVFLLFPMFYKVVNRKIEKQILLLYIIIWSLYLTLRIFTEPNIYFPYKTFF